jgi:predicted ATPase
MSVWLTEVEVRGDEYPPGDLYPFNIGPLQGRQKLTFNQSVTFLVGENGSGKSTLVEAIARQCGLHIWHQPKRRTAVSVMRLSDHLGVTLTNGSVKGGLFSAETFRDWAEFIDEVTSLDPGQAKYHGGFGLTARSHGEGLLAYFRGRYQIPGLYFLDEPEAALSPASQLDLLRLLDEYRQRGHAQFIIATHSPILMALPGAQILSFGTDAITEVDYRETEHFRIYRDFLANPESFLP